MDRVGCSVSVVILKKVNHRFVMIKKKLKEEIIKKSENNTIVVSYQKTLKNLFRICDSMEKNRTNGN